MTARSVPAPIQLSAPAGLVVLVLPTELVSRLDADAARKGITREELIARALRKELETP